MGITNEEAIKSLNTLRESINGVFDYNCRKQCIALDMAIQALKQQSSEDCISREALLNSLKGFEILHNHDELRSNLIYGIMNLPSVTPQPKIGRWIEMPLIEAGQTYSHECSLCGRKILVNDVGLSEFPYCHCGAKMEVEG